MVIREVFEQREAQLLAPYAMKSGESQGRQHFEPKHPLRTDFHRDKDRIVHSAAFRRLEYKTQVFLNHEGDHFRTRLTHTMEVAQISRSIARILSLNEDLTEAVALGHDIGHTCFGHVGENVLNALLADRGGFEHNIQALRIVERLESRYPEFPGLNLTYEVRRALTKNHHPYPESTLDWEDCRNWAPLLEAQVVDCADEIAYLTHDVDDGLGSGLLDLRSMDENVLWREVCDELRAKHEGISGRLIRHQGVRHLINVLATDIIRTTEENLRLRSLASPQEVRERGARVVALSPELSRKTGEMMDFLRTNLYDHPAVKEKTDVAMEVLRKLFFFYLDHPDKIPSGARKRAGEQPEERLVCDYLSGMTDRFALNRYREHFGEIPAVLRRPLTP